MEPAPPVSLPQHSPAVQSIPLPNSHSRGNNSHYVHQGALSVQEEIEKPLYTSSPISRRHFVTVQVAGASQCLRHVMLCHDMVMPSSCLVTRLSCHCHVFHVVMSLLCLGIVLSLSCRSHVIFMELSFHFHVILMSSCPFHVIVMSFSIFM